MTFVSSFVRSLRQGSFASKVVSHHSSVSCVPRVFQVSPTSSLGTQASKLRPFIFSQYQEYSVSTRERGFEAGKQQINNRESWKFVPLAAFVTVGSVTASAVCDATTEKGIDNDTLGEVTLYQYDVCPFCNKVKAFLDFHDVKYKVVEVNPLFKTELKWSEYQKVPTMVVNGEQLNNSADIVTELASRLEKTKPAAKKGGKGLFGFGKKMGSTANEEEAEWRAWVDSRLVHVITPNIYRTVAESFQAFDYMTQRGNFNYFERNAARVVGAVMMYMISKLTLKKRHNITEERPALYACIEEFTTALGQRNFLGGEKEPNLADLEIFGVIRAVKDMDTFTDIMEHTNLKPWFERMEAQVGESSAFF